jgi:hypothetical protein
MITPKVFRCVIGDRIGMIPTLDGTSATPAIMATCVVCEHEHLFALNTENLSAAPTCEICGSEVRRANNVPWLNAEPENA